jgi:DNA-binding MarR family transcriptional regulator
MTILQHPNRDPAQIPIDSPERKRLPALLRRAWYSLNQAFRRRIAHISLTPDQFTVLRILMEIEGKSLTQRELATEMSSDPNTVASLLERMETNGWIRRKAHESDGRANRIELTVKGRKLYLTAREVAISLQTEILAELPAERREQFLKDLDIVARACRHAADESPRRGNGRAGVDTLPN